MRSNKLNSAALAAALLALAAPAAAVARGPHHLLKKDQASAA